MRRVLQSGSWEHAEILAVWTFGFDPCVSRSLKLFYVALVLEMSNRSLLGKTLSSLSPIVGLGS